MKISTLHRRLGQTKMEAFIALALFAIAGFGAWALYGDQIVRTTETMIEYVQSFGQKEGE